MDIGMDVLTDRKWMALNERREKKMQQNKYTLLTETLGLCTM